MSAVLSIDYYSDILCVWAWIAQKRNDELDRTWQGKIQRHNFFLDLFADTQTRLGEGWKDKGGFDGFAEHVKEAAAPYKDAIINPACWRQVRPTTSSNGHMAIKAIEIIHGVVQAEKFAEQLRRAFFIDALDISHLSVIAQLISDSQLDKDKIQHCINSGAAIAALMSDSKQAQQQAIKGSPTWVMNNGRQVLYGNVGFRVLNANIEELQKHPQHEASWC